MNLQKAAAIIVWSLALLGHRHGLLLSGQPPLLPALVRSYPRWLAPRLLIIGISAYGKFEVAAMFLRELLAAPRKVSEWRLKQSGITVMMPGDNESPP